MTKTPPMIDFAILGPVPEQHLADGQAVAATEGFVAFGSRKWELFREVDRLRDGQDVPVLIYPSHEDIEGKLTFMVAWTGWYIGHVASKMGAHPAGMKHRPPSTAAYPADNSGHWAVFWHVRDLAPLPSDRVVRISSLESYKKPGFWRMNAPPLGPEVVGRPGWI